MPSILKSERSYTSIKVLRNLYYEIKPVIPRRFQIMFRRLVFLQKAKSRSHIWPIDENANQTPNEWSGWPEKKRFALVLTHDVESKAGHEKCIRLMEIEKKYGFRSSFNFVPELYKVSSYTRKLLVDNGFEVGVHGLLHDGRLYSSRGTFMARAVRINYYLKEWNAVGFRSPAMHHNLQWLHDLEIEYDASTFDTDPFEPQPDGVKTIFPFLVDSDSGHKGYIELPYTLPQDFTLFVIMRCADIDFWKRKLDWIAMHRGMALLITHPDYMNFGDGNRRFDQYPVGYYEEFLEYIKTRYYTAYWHALPKEIACWWRSNCV